MSTQRLLSQEEAILAATQFLAKKKPVHAVRCLKRNGFGPELMGDQLSQVVNELCRRKSFGEVLSMYWHAGVFGGISVLELLKRQAEVGDDSGLLKQALRFSVYDEIRGQIEMAIKRRRIAGQPDADAWDRKFSVLRDSAEGSPEALRTGVALDHLASGARKDEADGTSGEIFASPRELRLQTHSRPSRQRDALPDLGPVELIEPKVNDPRVVSTIARAKLERANREHARALAVLGAVLLESGIKVLSNQLIDAFCVLPSGPAIFEAKSISKDNERSQVRAALSQLYEYRYLHDLKDASLWALLSQEPESYWLVEYLLSDRGIYVIWADAEKIAGPSCRALYLSGRQT